MSIRRLFMDDCDSFVSIMGEDRFNSNAKYEYESKPFDIERIYDSIKKEKPMQYTIKVDPVNDAIDLFQEFLSRNDMDNLFPEIYREYRFKKYPEDFILMLRRTYPTRWLDTFDYTKTGEAQKWHNLHKKWVVHYKNYSRERKQND